MGRPRPEILLADEATGSLDSANGGLVLDLFRRLNRDRGVMVLLATHSAQAAAYAHRTIALRDGRVIRDTAA